MIGIAIDMCAKLAEAPYDLTVCQLWMLGLLVLDSNFVCDSIPRMYVFSKARQRENTGWPKGFV